jgi:isoleucyl-tRNA synthetase
VFRALVEYVAVDLSALYLDVVKDRLYSDAASSPSRRAAQSVLYTIARTLARLTAPILCFTAEDIWKHLPKRKGEPVSVHLADLPEGRLLDANDAFARRWETLLSYRDLATRELEAFRAQKHRSEDALVIVTPARGDRDLLEPRLFELAELFIVSKVALATREAETASVRIEHAPGQRCERCWKWYEQMSRNDPTICKRCASALCEDN